MTANLPSSSLVDLHLFDRPSSSLAGRLRGTPFLLPWGAAPSLSSLALASPPIRRDSRAAVLMAV